MKRAFSLFCMLGLFSVLLTMGCSRGQPEVSGEKVREFANALYNQELYPQALEEYQRYLDHYSMDEKRRANINFIIGNSWFAKS